MRTRSQARISVPEPPVRQPSVESSNLEKPDNPPIVTMDDNQLLAQFLEAPTEGYEDAIVVPEITANNFEIKHGLLNLVQNKQFFGHDKEDPHAHIRYFNKITSTMKFPNVPSTSVKLMLFPFSLEGAARIWLEKEPPRSILTWDDLVSKFINKFFPPSKTTNLRNEITRFQQKFDETFYEAWDRFNDLLRGCPHHGFSELHQLDTFYNALNSNDQDSLNSAAGGEYEIFLSPAVSFRCCRVKRYGLEHCFSIKKNKLLLPLRKSGGRASYGTCGGMNFLEEDSALIDVHGEQMTLRHDDQSVTFKVGDTKTLSYNIIETVNRVDVIDIACEEYVQEVLETSESGNPTSTSDLTIDSRSPSFTPFGGSDFLMEEIDEFLERDDSIPPGVDGIYDSEGDTVYLEELLSVINSDPNLPPSPVCEINVPEKVKSSCEDPPDLELKDLPSHLDLEVADIKGINHCFAPIRFDGGNAKRRSTSERVTPKSMRHVPKVSLVAIFQRYDEKTLKSFMDDFSVFGTLSLFAFPLGQNASKGIEVDKAKVDVIAKLPHPTTVKGIRSFLGHAGFYRRFIQDFSKIARPMTHLLEKETPFIFSKECIEAFETLKMKLTQAPILGNVDQAVPTDHTMQAKNIDEAQAPIYTTTEKGFTCRCVAFENSAISCLSKSIVYTDHSALKYLLAKQDAKPRLLRWILLTPRIDVEIRDNNGADRNLAARHTF
ncbi:reverse transcriptase domain-containing protein [Tanacetum coccineum]|uniref:Reverse transcriptase domain-containing protein n=1 Tax=Tanacetum coccineum TaxID=301880 RepID=A0ABQ5FQ85_9ASTR